MNAAGTPAGTTITNIASATFTDDIGATTVSSPASVFVVNEVIGVAVSPASANFLPVTPGQTEQPLVYRLTNSGNGPEAYTLAFDTAIGGDAFDPTCRRIVLDTNANGVFDPAADTTYAQGANDPLLSPDQSITVFALCDIPGDIADADRGLVDLTATAVTGSGPPGALFPGQGVGGSDALIGASTARQSAQTGYLAALVTPRLQKAQAVTDPAGGTTPIVGAFITYTLTADVPAGSVSNARVADPIPDGTSYRAGSLRLDGQALTDVADGDAGRFTGTAVEVSFGTLAAASPRIVTFQVRVDQ